MLSALPSATGMEQRAVICFLVHQNMAQITMHCTALNDWFNASAMKDNQMLQFYMIFASTYLWKCGAFTSFGFPTRSLLKMFVRLSQNSLPPLLHMLNRHYQHVIYFFNFRGSENSVIPPHFWVGKQPFNSIVLVMCGKRLCRGVENKKI